MDADEKNVRPVAGAPTWRRVVTGFSYREKSKAFAAGARASRLPFGASRGEHLGKLARGTHASA
ncbi:MAG: hypothetical protein M3O82_07535, partial [Verrucomicrobiota bacterium]|nr:hypothetical protein [Verrucomicrobiota bacterium]